MNITVNQDKLGKNLYEMMNEKQQAIVAFGMIPKEVIDQLEEQTRIHFAEKWAKKYNITLSLQEKIDIGKNVKQQIISEILHKATVGIFTAASKQNRMIV